MNKDAQNFMKVLIFIAAGGAVGAMGRYVAISIVSQLCGAGFPYGTVVVNVLGSLALGMLIESMTLIWSPSSELRAFLIIGLLGSFTTFSAFSFDVVALIQRNEFILSTLYIIASVTLSVAAFFLGMYLYRQVFA